MTEDKLSEELVKDFAKKIDDNYELFEGYNKSLQLIFTASNASYWIKVGKDGHTEKVEKGLKEEKESDTIMVFKSSKILQGLFAKEINPQAAMSSGEFKIKKGSLNDLIKFAPLF